MASNSHAESMLNDLHHRVDTHRFGSFSFAGSEEDPYFVTQQKPKGLDIVKKTTDEFVRFQLAKKRPVVLVTSGGTTVPLEVCCTFSAFGFSGLMW
jgi:hypothetical protein